MEKIALRSLVLSIISDFIRDKITFSKNDVVLQLEECITSREFHVIGLRFRRVNGIRTQVVSLFLKAFRNRHLQKPQECLFHHFH